MSQTQDERSDKNVEECNVHTEVKESIPSSSSTLQSLQNACSETTETLCDNYSRNPQGNTSTANVNPTPIGNLAAQCQNINLNDTENTRGKSKTPRRRNFKKKEKLKQLKMPNGNAYVASAPILTNSVQDFFNKQISPMYASNSTRYLENMSYHPQFQYMSPPPGMVSPVGLHPLGYVVSVPNTPLVPEVQRNIPSSLPNSPQIMIDSSTNKFIQNSMQHPLLKQSFPIVGKGNVARHVKAQMFRNVDGQHNMGRSEESATKQSPRRANKNKGNGKKTDHQNNDDLRFEPYLSKEEVELGLQNNLYIEGVLRINPKQFQHAYISNSDRSEQDVFIYGIKNRNRSLEGDIVVVQLILDSENEANVEDNTDDNVEGDTASNGEDKIPSNNECKSPLEGDTASNEETKAAKQANAEINNQKRGKVIYIKEEVHTRKCIGTLKLMPDKNRQKALFVPRDHRIPRLNIPFTSWPDNFYKDAKSYENTLFLAKIVEWSNTKFAMGIITSQIGQSGDMKAETLAILAQNDLNISPFEKEMRDLFPRLDYVIPEEEIKIRQDCRSLCAFSIDPSNCRDIDDAVSCRELENGNYEIGVHISDVAHYLTENTILDEKVASKATTIYLVERAYHMLPDELCMLCSLFPGVDKLAFSVFWEITKDARIINNRITKTVINSCCQLAYEHAQAILEDREDAKEAFPETYNGFKYEDIQKSIKILGNISAIMRKNRFEGGALRIDQPKVAFHLNSSNGLPDSFWIYESKQSHQLIEEFMLLANMTVATRINEDHPTLAFLRCHPPPNEYMMKQLAKVLKPMDIEIDISSAGALHRSLLPYVGPESDQGKAMVLNMLCAKPMTRAKYFCASGCDDDDFQHYALNVPLYTHFTSPIRRYADIMVHRLLAASLNYREVPKWDVDKVRAIAAQCNKQKYNAKRAGEMSTELYTLKYIEMNSPVVTEAVVVEVREKYIDVIVVTMGLNRRIFFNNDFPGKFKCIKNDLGVKLTKMEVLWNGTDSLPEKKQVIEVFSVIQIELYRDDDMTKVATKLVRPK